MFAAPVQEEKPQAQVPDIHQQNDKENLKITAKNEVKPRKGESTFKLGEPDDEKAVSSKKSTSTFQLGEQDDEKAVSFKKSIDPLRGAVLGESNSPVDPKEGNVAPAPRSTTRMPPGGHTTPFW